MATLDINRLPNEILLKILQGSRSLDAYNAALVCKAWVIPAQSALFSCVSIHCESRLEELYNAIKNSTQLGNKVKTLFIQIPILPFNESYRVTGIKVSSLLSSLFPLLCNLERFYDFNTFSYTPLFDALSSSHLKHLKMIREPRMKGVDEYLDYLNCALLMKDRLECISLTDNIFKETRLGSELHQFRNLVDLTISLRTDDEIDVFERCESVKNISFDFNSLEENSFGQQPTNNITVPMMSNYDPNVAVRKLRGKLTNRNNLKLVKYFMQKFPQLDELDLHFTPSKTVHQFDLSFVAELLVYISRIEEFNIRGLLSDQAGILKTIGKAWHTTSIGYENLKIRHCNDPHGDTRITLDIEKSGLRLGKLTTIRYNGAYFEWLTYMDFIQQSGRYICDLELEYITYFPHSLSDMLYLHDDFIPHTLTYCTDLQYLRMERCIFERVYNTGVFTGRKLSLRKLSLHICTIFDGVLEQMSQILQNIDCLDSNNIKFLRTGYELPSTAFDIVMPNTNINTIVLRGYSRDDTVFVKVMSIDENSCCYYRFDFSKYEYIKCDSNEQEYNTLNNQKYINICCRTSPTIEVLL